MNLINPNVFPKGGYFFNESDGAKIVGQTWTGVIARVRNYRKRAGLPAGNPEEEVISQACARDPSLCRQDNGARIEQTKRASLKNRVLKWLAAIQAKGPTDFVRDQDARNRATVCAACHLNIDIAGGCASCKESLAQYRKEILGRNFRDNRLHACIGTGEDTQVAVWVEQPAQDNPELPGHCWRKKTL